MKRYIVMVLTLMGLIILAACNAGNMMDTPMDTSDENSEDNTQGSMMGQGSMGMGHGHDDVHIQNSTGENRLNIPPLLEKDKEDGNNVYYTIEAQKGQTEIFDGVQTDTLGYNEPFLGPVLRLEKGQTAHLTLKNKLDEATTFHWHGLIIEGEADGGPHSVIQPGEEKEITFDVQQDSATLWFHPHPKGKTAKQVFEGLAGLMYIEDEANDNSYVYGENDFPLIIQDRTFNEEKQLEFEAVKDEDGTLGETLLINGTLNPYLAVKQEKVRLRLLNGSNMRNYTFKLSNNQSFQQIASDGGLLNKPVELTEIQLTPSERAEIVVDFSQLTENEKIALVTDDETVLLPFKVTDAVAKETKGIQFPEAPIALTQEELDKPVSKRIELFGMGEHVTINGKKFDMNRIDFTQKKGETEIWEIYNKPDMMGGMIHPFHIHGTQFKVISVNGEAPPANLQGYKDTIALDPGDKAKIAVKFPEEGVFMYHCHILEHEDNGMMGQVKVE
ncbi:multicopper oxidase family protein [Lentibacillus saliphilus]|uniref:multicopper oxidase family protein n=1 Tax=Lentibacillus saliphilus TaxID=2737028 RepID=UPI001C2F688D|nr:multicopper oxidase domain-containing protein [Lentibacillus saliphilus]